MKEWRHIAWEPAPDPWCTLNSDGSVNQNGAAAAGGVLRNYEGEILSAYTMNLGSCSITRAEIRGIVEGMNLAWERGVRHLAIQTDSRCAVQILSNQNNVDHQHAGLVKLFTKLLERDWIVSLSHVYRESNFLADSLAALGHASPFGTHFIEASDPSVASWHAYDRLRSSQPRLVLRSL
ncbi:Putative ribonuclease H protein At1g65750 [Linum perenne]